MDTNTQTSGMPVPPAVLSGKEVYDLLMKDIDADLMSDSLPLLKEKYANETADEKAARAARYNKAFAEYEKKFAAYNREWENHFRTYKREAIGFFENKHKSSESSELETIESSLTAE